MANLLNTALGPLKVKAWLGIAALLGLLAFVVIRVADNADKRKIETAKEAGASSAVIAGHETTLGQLKDANDAETDLRAGGERSADRYNQCLQDSDRPGACERYKPVELVPGR
jgi:hypothetical protein